MWAYNLAVNERWLIVFLNFSYWIVEDTKICRSDGLGDVVIKCAFTWLLLIKWCDYRAMFDYSITVTLVPKKTWNHYNSSLFLHPHSWYFSILILDITQLYHFLANIFSKSDSLSQGWKDSTVGKSLQCYETYWSKIRWTGYVWSLSIAKSKPCAQSDGTPKSNTFENKHIKTSSFCDYIAFAITWDLIIFILSCCFS